MNEVTEQMEQSVTHVGMMLTATDKNNVNGYLDRNFNFVANIADAYIMTSDEASTCADAVIGLADSNKFAKLAIMEVVLFEGKLTSVYNQVVQMLLEAAESENAA